EYYRLHDKQQAIIVSYSHLFQPAMSGIITGGIGLLVVAVAPIPLIQKVAIFASFWGVSIFISVVTLHPILLSYVAPPPQPHQNPAPRPVPINAWAARAILWALVGAAYAAVRTGLLNSSLLAFVIISPGLAWYWLHYGDRAYVAWSR